MKVLLIHRSDYAQGGGGAIAMHRLHTGLRQAGIDSTILCSVKTMTSPTVMKLPRPTRWRLLEAGLRRVTQRVGLNDVHAVSAFAFKNHKVFQTADLLNFHGLHGNYFSYLALPSLTQEKPAIFTLQDMWAFTGHCAVNYDCERWKTGCGRCPYPDAHPAVKHDGTRLEWKLKKWVYSRSNLTIVTLSRRQTEFAKQSLLGHLPIYCIPNGVDTRVFEPLDSELCRRMLGIPSNKRVLMAAALNLSQFWKGGDLLIKALQALPRSLQKELVLILIGDKGSIIAESTDIQTLDLGYVSNDRLKAICYSAAHLFVHPTRVESLGLVLLESMACGTPAVSFDVGGVPDLVRPGLTGYLAQPENAAELRDGIVQLLEDEPRRRAMGQECRRVVLHEYSLDLIVKKYVALYRRVLNQVEPQDSDLESTNSVRSE
ncbi:MAG: glycosyltransferase [Anaerolineae bacterium]|jgi:glycosyltransferase involved in cell wall biosynthesis|nr:glycosyltransferase [Anaerolineae bacterium]MDH7473669.1 glycosyltransferase [Anaerolineae bacterium]